MSGKRMRCTRSEVYLACRTQWYVPDDSSATLEARLAASSRSPSLSLSSEESLAGMVSSSSSSEPSLTSCKIKGQKSILDLTGSPWSFLVILIHRNYLNFIIIQAQCYNTWNLVMCSEYETE